MINFGQLQRTQIIKTIFTIFGQYTWIVSSNVGGISSINTARQPNASNIICCSSCEISLLASLSYKVLGSGTECNQIFFSLISNTFLKLHLFLLLF